MKAYLSVSFSARKLLEQSLNSCKNELIKFGIEPFIFVDHYQFSIADEKTMMEQAMIDIQKSDILLAETSKKGIGIGIEVGYAKALGKDIIYLRHEDSEHSTTVSGISDYQIIYSSKIDLESQLSKILILICNKRVNCKNRI